MLIKLFGGAVDHLVRGLEYASARHEVLARNIANLETPGYQARDLVFDDALAPARPSAPGGPAITLTASGPADRQPRLVAAGDAAAGPDGNDVSLDRQMARLSENTLFHNALVQILAGQFNTLKQAIAGRA
jgi:flagellar basal-body rod protein FlgB